MSHLQVLLLAAEALHLNHRSGVNSTGDFSKVEYVLDTEMQARVDGAVHPASVQAGFLPTCATLPDHVFDREARVQI